MEQKEFNIEEYDYTFRIAKMNAIEVLAIRTQINFTTYDASIKLFSTILENIEVNIDGQWFKVKTKGKNSYMPLFVENDVILVDKLIAYFTNNFLKEVFQKSSE